MKTKLMLAGVAAAAAASLAVADYTFTFNQQSFAGGELVVLNDLGFTGTLTAVTGNFVLNSVNGANSTWANDLTILVSDSGVGVFQVGGWDGQNGIPGTDGAAANHNMWNGTGGAGAPGTTINTTVNMPAGGIPMLPGTQITWGNGFNLGAGGAVWSGEITLHGINKVPAPGALALLGVAGLAGMGRRRRA